jgi:hypothetical protein
MQDSRPLINDLMLFDEFNTLVGLPEIRVLEDKITSLKSETR